MDLKTLYNFMTEKELAEASKVGLGGQRIIAKLLKLAFDPSIVNNIDKVDWYDEFSKTLASAFDKDEAAVFGGLLAATSPRTAVLQNLLLSLDLFEIWVSEGKKPLTSEKLKEIKDKLPASKFPGIKFFMKTHMNGVEKVFTEPEKLLNQGYLSFFQTGKIDSFRQNLLRYLLPQNDIAVTNDSWVFKSMGFNQNDSKEAFKKQIYPFVSSYVRYLTDLANKNRDKPLSPSDTQASLWLLFRGLDRALGRAKISSTATGASNPYVSLENLVPGLYIKDPSRRFVGLKEKTDNLKEQVFKEIQPHDFIQYDYRDLLSVPAINDRLKRINPEVAKKIAVELPKEGKAVLPKGQPNSSILTPTKGLEQMKERATGSSFVSTRLIYSKEFDSVKNYSRARKGDIAFASPSTDVGLSFKEAFRRLSSSQTAAYISLLSDALKKISPTIKRALGVWLDGAEPSVVIETDTNDPNTLDYIGAWAGLLGKQKSVLVFSPDEKGDEYLYHGEVSAPIDRADKMFNDVGITYRTLVPNEKSTSFYLYQTDEELAKKLKERGEQDGVPVSYKAIKGKGKFMGADERAKAASIFRDTIDQYEKR